MFHAISSESEFEKSFECAHQSAAVSLWFLLERVQSTVQFERASWNLRAKMFNQWFWCDKNGAHSLRHDGQSQKRQPGTVCRCIFCWWHGQIVSGAQSRRLLFTAAGQSRRYAENDTTRLRWQGRQYNLHRGIGAAAGSTVGHNQWVRTRRLL